MTRSPRILIPAICVVIALNTNAFGQVRKYTESFDKDRQSDPKIIESLQHLKTSHSKLNTEDLLKKLNDWGTIGATSSALPRAAFKLKEDVIVMKVFWDEEVESKPKEWTETEGMNHCFRVANEITNEWNKDRSCRLVRFAGLELLAFPMEVKEAKQQDDGSKKLEVVASPEVLILL